MKSKLKEGRLGELLKTTRKNKEGTLKPELTNSRYDSSENNTSFQKEA
ncbi:hypothetical protein [Paenibacillus dendritiformis]|nr:hypothetical protein [Paenibacillus dendritiformis]